MTQLVARLILTMLILPIAGAVFVLGFAVIAAMNQGSGPLAVGPVIAVWAVVYLVVGFTWIMIWRPVVRWTPRRVGQTVLSGIIAIMAGIAFALTVLAIVRSAAGGQQFPIGIAALLGGGVPPIVWVLSTVLTWRETREERTRRLAGAGPGAEPVVCPMCGYDLGGAREARCPECGVAFTIGQLVAAQPHKDLRSLDDG